MPHPQIILDQQIAWLNENPLPGFEVWTDRIAAALTSLSTGVLWSAPLTTPGTATAGPCPSCGASLEERLMQSVASPITGKSCTLWACSRCSTEVLIPTSTQSKPTASGSNGSEVSEVDRGQDVLERYIWSTSVGQPYDTKLRRHISPEEILSVLNRAAVLERAEAVLGRTYMGHNARGPDGPCPCELCRLFSDLRATREGK